MGTNSSPGPIISHPDVKRMLLDMKSTVEARRALALYAAFQLDLGGAHPDRPRARAGTRRSADSIVKGFCRRAASRSPRPAYRFMEAWAASRKPVPHKRCATCASPPYETPPASSRTT
jgi:hypothetical protein